MKKLISILMACLMISCLFACDKKASNEQASNNAAVTNTAVTNNASANIPAEYKQVTVNENGVKIYGKIVGSSSGGANASASPEATKVINKNKSNDEELVEEGLSVTYSEYYSEAYGGKVIIRTGDKGGEQGIYNENGQQFLSNDSKAAKNDLENTLAKYRLGNAMAEAIDRKVNGN